MKKLCGTFALILFSMSIVTTTFAADPDQKDGLDAALTPAQVQAEAQKYESNKNQLRDLLREVRSILTPQAARDQLRSTIEQIVASGNSSPKETFIHYSLNRAMKLSDLL
jgi:hypothetical protein